MHAGVCSSSNHLQGKAPGCCCCSAAECSSIPQLSKVSSHKVATWEVAGQQLQHQAVQQHMHRPAVQYKVNSK
jgi:hypothetical protein